MGLDAVLRDHLFIDLAAKWGLFGEGDGPYVGAQRLVSVRRASYGTENDRFPPCSLEKQ